MRGTSRATHLLAAELMYLHVLPLTDVRPAVKVRHTAVEIIEYPIDLSTAPSAVLDQIDKLAATAWEARDVSIRTVPSASTG
ncbi:hypothetical protein [Amycolatopsis speibonae]|uniref:Uncharacterized protein n=1 Tax=Amycolatopsis speibonae TaxID=1450224 RepID=A0ABV7P7P1_9PSEU